MLLIFITYHNSPPVLSFLMHICLLIRPIHYTCASFSFKKTKILSFLSITSSSYTFYLIITTSILPSSKIKILDSLLSLSLSLSCACTRTHSFLFVSTETFRMFSSLIALREACQLFSLLVLRKKCGWRKKSKRHVTSSRLFVSFNKELTRAVKNN
jgi:hypothetical protein